MERADRAALAGVLAPAALAPGEIEVGEDGAHHLRVRRVAPGDALRVTDGQGRLAVGTLAALGKRSATITVSEVSDHAPPPPFHLLVPVGDRDRMLLLAEKAVELGVRSWTPVTWRRSRSVTPRGEGAAFDAKLRARMASALVQSGGAWLPEVRGAVDVAVLPDRIGEGDRVLLDADGAPLFSVAAAGAAVWIAFGPEGGAEPDERAALDAAGFARASLAEGVLRFETAGIAALAVLHGARLLHAHACRAAAGGAA